jgi:predicted HTH domain antitoxin
VLSLSLDLPPDISADEARLMLALKLFEEHRISMGKAAELAGYSKSTFMELAGKHGVAVFDYPAGELEREATL